MDKIIIKFNRFIKKYFMPKTIKGRFVSVITAFCLMSCLFTTTMMMGRMIAELRTEHESFLMQGTLVQLGKMDMLTNRVEHTAGLMAGMFDAEDAAALSSSVAGAGKGQAGEYPQVLTSAMEIGSSAGAVRNGFVYITGKDTDTRGCLFLVIFQSYPGKIFPMEKFLEELFHCR